MAVTPVSFDIAGLEIFLPLVGGRMVMASHDVALDGEQLRRKLRRPALQY